MREIAAVVVEEGVGIDEGCIREFWVGTEGLRRNTLSVESTCRGIELKWVVDTPDVDTADAIEQEFAMEIGTEDAWRFLRGIEREIYHEGRV
ncbi:hypothetical protein ABZ714_13110 [Streptomyces sp. NPDC006798]|uniref:hypothetical protein n=1 Tax=Streptomyces sp. NPDC006798 TaxID=3155462 RepID=UPI0033FDBFD1